jgi:hypothetical protein
MATEKIMISINDQVIELKGADKEAFIADREATAQAQLLIETEKQANRELKKSAYTKLGLTEEEINAIL